MRSRKSEIAIEKETERPRGKVGWSREPPYILSWPGAEELRTLKSGLIVEGCIAQ